jgi:hypothetical protein
MKTRLPPFGREVSRILNNPSELNSFACCHAHRGSVWVATGPGAWDWKYRHPHLLVIVMPDGDSPNSYDWGFLCGHEPPLILPPVSNDQEKCIELAAAMMRDGVLSVLAVHKSRSMKYLREAA